MSMVCDGTRMGQRDELFARRWFLRPKLWVLDRRFRFAGRAFLGRDGKCWKTPENAGRKTPENADRQNENAGKRTPICLPRLAAGRVDGSGIHVCGGHGSVVSGAAHLLAPAGAADEELQAFCATRPVMLFGKCPRRSWTNSRALKVCRQKACRCLTWSKNWFSTSWALRGTKSSPGSCRCVG